MILIIIFSYHNFIQLMNWLLIKRNWLKSRILPQTSSKLLHFCFWKKTFCPQGPLEHMEVSKGQISLCLQMSIAPPEPTSYIWHWSFIWKTSYKSNFVDINSQKFRIEPRKQSCSLTRFSVIPLESPTYKPIETVSVFHPNKFTKVIK